MKKALLLFALALGLLATEATVTQAAPPLRRAAVNAAWVPAMSYRSVRYGPYLSLRRADDVAVYFRLRGFRARVLVEGRAFWGVRRYTVIVSPPVQRLRYGFVSPW